MKKLSLHIVLIIAIGIFSCQREVAFEDIYSQDEVVVNSIFTSDSTWFVNLTWSRSILEVDYNGFDFIEGADVKILDEFGNAAELINVGTGWYGSEDNTPKTGVQYRIEVNVDGRDLVTASDRLPDTVAITELEHNSKNNFKEQEVYFSVEFKDPPGEDYYYLEAYHEDVHQSGYDNAYDILALNGNFQLIYPELLGQDYFYGRAYVTDKGFDGQTMRLDFIIAQYWDSGFIRLRLVHASRNAYLYTYSTEVQDISEFNPFAQPAIIHNNIENGIGTFSGYSFVERRLKIGQ